MRDRARCEGSARKSIPRCVHDSRAQDQFVSRLTVSLDMLTIKKEIDSIAQAMTIFLFRRLAAEFPGTAVLVAAVVGSGVMAERLANSNVGGRTPRST